MIHFYLLFCDFQAAWRPHEKGGTEIPLPRSALFRGIHPTGAWSWTLNEISTMLGGSRGETILAPHKELGYIPTRGTELGELSSSISLAVVPTNRRAGS